MRSQKGFTLIELLIVVVIIGILAAIAIPKFSNTREKAYVAAMKSDLRNLVTAQESFFADNASVYGALASLGTNYKASTGVTVTITGGGTSLWSGAAAHGSTKIACTITNVAAEPVCQ